jgi:Flp pilus assembly protein TadG
MRAFRLQIESFRRSQSGAALVEFAVSLPLILIVAFGIIESMRLLWSFQAAVAGVRDATRYVARAVPDDICANGGSLAGWNGQLTTIVNSSITGAAIFPDGITLNGVTATLACPDHLDLRQDQVPVATVTADLTMQFPFSAVFRLAGGDGWGTINTSIAEEARIFGL